MTRNSSSWHKRHQISQYCHQSAPLSGLALYYFADYAYGRCLLPDWIASWLEWRFGPLACPAPSN